MRVESWVLLAAVAALALGVDEFAYARGHAPAGETACGLGPPPGSPGYAEAMARHEAEVRERGYELVCDANLVRYDIPWKRRPMSETRLAFEPVDLTRTPFARLEDMGNQVETVSGVRARLYRRFRLPDGHMVVLSEHDLSADGLHVWRDPKDEPERINGRPARLVVLQTASGRAVSDLNWVEGRRDYELWLDANIGRSGPLRDTLFALASSLPASKPACPNEPPAKPVRIGPDGMPVDDPPPAVLTQADVDAMSKPRPCK
jgi:hypothetical protein